MKGRSPQTFGIFATALLISLVGLLSCEPRQTSKQAQVSLLVEFIWEKDFAPSSPHLAVRARPIFVGDQDSGFDHETRACIEMVDGKQFQGVEFKREGKTIFRALNRIDRTDKHILELRVDSTFPMNVNVENIKCGPLVEAASGKHYSSVGASLPAGMHRFEAVIEDGQGLAP